MQTGIHWHQRFIAHCAGLGVSVLAIAAMGVWDEAQARTYRTSQRPPAVEKREAPKRQDSLLAVVSIAKQRITVYGPQGVIGHSPVSTGMRGHDTPTGVFTILQKNRFHRSNIYSGAPMPFMQRLTWSGVALHAGALPGYPASHGCVRLPAAFAQDLWDTTRLGARVVVVPDGEHPKEVSHGRLPAPTLLPATAEISPPVKTAAIESDEKSDATPAVAEPRLLNPVERARASKATLAADAVTKLQEAKARVAASAVKAREANLAIHALRLAERQVADAQSRIAYLEKFAAAQRHPAAVERVKAMQTEAEGKLAAATAAIAPAQEREKVATEEAFEAARLAWTAEKESEAATVAAKSAEKASSGDPISIFVSRKTGRVQIRQGWETLHDAPATFKEATAPLGTHVYVALEPVGKGESLRWISVSLSGGETVREPAHHRRGAKPAAPPAPRSTETAESVLEKFEIGPETAKFISERLWTGATLIVSDQGPSHETGKHTDFVILAR